MASMKNLSLLSLCHLLLLLLITKADSKCQKSYPCRDFTIEFPFTHINSSKCGLFPVNCDYRQENPGVFLGGREFPMDLVKKVSANKFLIHDPVLENYFNGNSCFSLLKSPSVSFTFSPNLTSFSCFNLTQGDQNQFAQYQNKTCDILTIFYKTEATQAPIEKVPPGCIMNQMPINSDQDFGSDVFNLLSPNFTLEWHVSQDCYECYGGGGQCLINNKNEFYCKQGCGLITVYGCDFVPPYPTLNLGSGSRGYNIVGKNSTNEISVFDIQLGAQLRNRSCFSFTNLSMIQSPSISYSFTPNLTLFSCYLEFANQSILEERFENYRKIDCLSTFYYRIPTTNDSVFEEDDVVPHGCSLVQLPMKTSRDSDDLFSMLTANFTLEWNVSEHCLSCFNGGGQCLTDNENQFYCKKDNDRWKLIIAICIPIAVVLLLLVAIFILWQRKKRLGGAYLLSRNLSSDPSSKSDIEDGSFNFGIPIFSYTELVEATGNFDPTKELGDGGFGTVYYGKLRDGREVAIKRLYEHNYRRVEQFLNEIKILTSLRHPNLVSLYGCTSRRSRELLLVYEYIPNGTVADHLHGVRAQEAPLTWPVRMSIARETATALAYLHKSDIIHRDVKTNNILLDSNFSVKVADFGLSRLFPIDVTHISTAPQGTPGYVDPEYHQCYQLTDKSDVYSFGVVLIELISSMPAVDISRHKHEINLANLAVNKIQKCAFDELIDPSTGYKSDVEATRMTMSVAELAFRCLQLDKDMRPSMEEVVAFLRDIQSGEDCSLERRKEGNGKIPPSPETDEAVLLKSKFYQSSPTAVTDTWNSISTGTSSVG